MDVCSFHRRSRRRAKPPEHSCIALATLLATAVDEVPHWAFSSKGSPTNSDTNSDAKLVPAIVFWERRIGRVGIIWERQIGNASDVRKGDNRDPCTYRLKKGRPTIVRFYSRKLRSGNVNPFSVDSTKGDGRCLVLLTSLNA